MEIREFEIREVNQEERTVSGLAVPFDQTIEVGGFRESFARGAFDDNVTATLFYGHDHRSGGLPIGKLIKSRNTDKGYEVTARISETDKGNEVYQLLKDGVLNRFSVGFEPITDRETKDGVVVRTKALLKEVSIVPMPAYTGAVIAEVRDNSNNKENEMTEMIDNSEEVADLRSAVNDLERKFAVLGDTKSDTHATSQFRSGGEWLSALAKGEDAARMQVRAFTGATTADSIATPAWLNDQLRIVEEKRDVLNLFNRSALPSTGNSIEYPKVSAETGTVGAQGGEGLDLPYMEVALTTATAPVVTYGGYSALSRQAIERSDVAYLDAVLRFQTQQYAKATNIAVRNALVNATGVQTLNAPGSSPDAATPVLVNPTAIEWVSMVNDAAALVDDNARGAQAEVLVVSRDVFRQLIGLTDSTGRPMFVLNGDGINSVGNATVRNARGTIAGMPVVVIGGLADNTALFVSAEAITSFESAGAPFRLQDENIINLTKDFSLYGYMAVAVKNPLAVVKVRGLA